MKRNFKTPKTTHKQKEILQLLLKFRFLNTHHIQLLLNHKNPTRILKMIKDLIEKDCVRRIYNRKSFVDNSKPALYYLGPKSRHILSDICNLELSDLEYIYKEHRRNDKFISRCLFLADIYLFLLSNQEENNDLKFFTKFELGKYEYFPDPLPDAFVAVKTKSITSRYMLDYFDENTPPFVVRSRIRKYIEYAEGSAWDENTNFADFPNILFVFSSERLMKHAKIYGRTQLEKTYEDKVSMFVTTQNMIKFGKIENIWEKFFK